MQSIERSYVGIWIKNYFEKWQLKGEYVYDGEGGVYVRILFLLLSVVILDVSYFI